MKLTAYQIVAPFFSLVAILYAWNLMFRKKKTLIEAVLWTVFWGSVAYIAIYPSVLTYLSALTGIANAENAALVTFIGILFFMMFYLIIRLEELEQRHTKIIRILGLREAGLDSEKTMSDER
jgi:hypothetical protein